MTDITLILATLLSGIATFWFASQISIMVNRSLQHEVQVWQHDEQRKCILRSKSPLYRWFQPLCDDLLQCRWLHLLGNIRSVETSLAQGGSELPWTAAEYLAVGTVRTTLAMAFCVAIAFPIFEATGSCLIAIIVGIMSIAFLPRQLATLAKLRMRRFKQRLPFAIDLMALMMEAGGDFRQCLSTVVHENRGHPVGVEFGLLSNSHAAGQSLRDCLDQMQARLRDEDVNEIVFSIKNADELGVPLSRTFLTLAEQMRLKRAQQAEKLIGERKTMMAFPSLIIMIACLLVAVAPFVLCAIYDK